MGVMGGGTNGAVGVAALLLKGDRVPVEAVQGIETEESAVDDI